MHYFKSFLFSMTVLVTATSSGTKHIVFTDPEKAGPDFQVQGEYVGRIGGGLPVGAQVIALGKHEFQGVFYTGGLPGAGWDESTVFHIKGKTHDGETNFHGIHGERLMFPNANFRGSIRDGGFTGEAQMFGSRLEDVTFRLTKVHRSSPTLGKRPPKGSNIVRT